MAGLLSVHSECPERVAQDDWRPAWNCVKKSKENLWKLCYRIATSTAKSQKGTHGVWSATNYMGSYVWRKVPHSNNSLLKTSTPRSEITHQSCSGDLISFNKVDKTIWKAPRLTPTVKDPYISWTTEEDVQSTVSSSKTQNSTLPILSNQVFHSRNSDGTSVRIL